MNFVLNTHACTVLKEEKNMNPRAIVINSSLVTRVWCISSYLFRRHKKNAVVMVIIIIIIIMIVKQCAITQHYSIHFRRQTITMHLCACLYLRKYI